MSDHDIQLLRKAGFSDLESALAAINSMSDEIRSLHTELENLERQYGFAMAERDEARWEVCELSSNGSIDGATRISVERGWDCFKDNP